MKLVAITQRVDRIASYAERRDALDQRWCTFIAACGFAPLVIPNHAETAAKLVTALPVAGILLTGGEDLAAYGGDVPERDETEKWLLEHAMSVRRPVVGVCRGMQVIQHHFGVPLEPVDGHVTASQDVTVDGKREIVNSYHRLGARTSVPDLAVWARADDGVVKAVRHVSHAVLGFMWHPERFANLRQTDVDRVRTFMSGETA